MKLILWSPDTPVALLLALLAAALLYVVPRIVRGRR